MPRCGRSTAFPGCQFHLGGPVTYAGFIVAGAIPLLSFIYRVIVPGGKLLPFLWSAAFAGLVFFIIRALKSKFADQTWYWGSLETLALGGGAAALAYLVGAALRYLIGPISLSNDNR